MASAGAETPAPVAPPAGFHTTDRDLGPTVGGDEHARVQNPVLFGPDKFLTLQKQDTNIPLVLDGQIGNGTRFGHLFDRDRAFTDRLVG